MAQLYKVWSADRKQRIFVAVDRESEMLYFDIIAKASKKLDVDGSRLVLESDGTELDTDTINLINPMETILILLEKSEIWKSQASSCSTLTISSSSSLDDLPVVNDSPRSPLLHESFWLEYEIPFEKLDKDTLTELDNEKRNKTIKNVVTNFVIDQIRKERTSIPSKALKIIAKKIVDRYPGSFKDIDDDEVVLGDGLYSTYQKLLDRNNYLNRPHKRPVGEKSSPQNIKYKKLAVVASSGCKNWQPVNILDTTEEVIIASKENLQVIVQKLDILDEEEKKKVITDLETTYYAQRTYLNEKQPSILDILKEWPILLIHDYMCWHYEKLMGHSIKNLSENFKLKKFKLIEFGKRNKLCEETEWDDDTSANQALKIVTSYFKENPNLLLLEFDEDMDLDQVKIAIPSPIMVHFKECRYYVYVENKRINDGVENLYECLEELFAVYYIFNMAYPKNISCTLEFLQRYFLKIHPDSGTKSKKGLTAKHRVLAFINKIQAVCS